MIIFLPSPSLFEKVFVPKTKCRKLPERSSVVYHRCNFLRVTSPVVLTQETVKTA
jgi:hypothetical protein